MSDTFPSDPTDEDLAILRADLLRHPLDHNRRIVVGLVDTILRERGRATVAWGADAGITWANATPEQREQFALVRLFWYLRMREQGGPDGSELDAEVRAEAIEAAAWFGPILEARAREAGA